MTFTVNHRFAKRLIDRKSHPHDAPLIARLKPEVVDRLDDRRSPLNAQIELRKEKHSEQLTVQTS